MFDILIKNTDSVKSMPEKRFKIAISKYVDLSCMTIGEDKVFYTEAEAIDFAKKCLRH